MEVTRLFDLLPYYKNSFKPKDDVLAGKEGGIWVKYSIDQYIEAATNISYGLLYLGIKPGDKIATISNNRPEWNFLDMGILQIGAVHVPIYPTISESDYKYILAHSEVKFVFISGKEIMRKIEHILLEIPAIQGIFTFKPIDGVKLLDELIELGRSNPQPDKVELLKAAITPKDLATLIYTSGTTGFPKGVMLTHQNILSNVMGVKHIFPVDESCKGISYLPLCHVYERMDIYTYHYLGMSIYYAENMGTIADNIREVKPEIFTTVPRLLEKVYDKIIAKGSQLKGFKKGVFFWAVTLANHYELEGKSWLYLAQLRLADRLVFTKWREALGGNVRVIVSGGAALQPRLAKIFTAAGIPILEGYGLTETSPVIAVNTLEKGGRMFGTVGKPLSNVDVKIATDGEILAKGSNIMMGYFKDAEMTSQAIEPDGWFHTGDVGKLEPEGHLRITGRKKEIFKTSLGKYISPQLLENKFKESHFIDGIIILGENQKYAAALVVPDFNHLRSWCEHKSIEYSSDKEMIKNPIVKKRFRKEIGHFNKFFGNTEQIQNFELIDHEWSLETGELTANLKLKRSYILDKYKEEVERLFK
ncbi:MAG: long-chain fatty acid--CoA ligase [Bacteroidales bacterium]|nr:long-chain fatty acid--CoA ligase [Bacteroidales bacterium]